MPGSYYADKVPSLRDLFGTEDVSVESDAIRIAGRRYPVVDDVVVLLDEKAPASRPFAEDIQFTFGAEWRAFPRVLEENRSEFEAYFDLVDLSTLRGSRALDLGCGIGRWSHFLAPHCRELVLVDFSDAIHVARRNLAGVPSALFFKADLTALPFADGCADLAFSLGVLHHLPLPALDAVRSLSRLAPNLLVYLYYALDNRAPHFRALLAAVTATRRLTSRVRGPRLRAAITTTIAATIYEPLIAAGRLADLAGRGRLVPLYDSYAGKGFERVRQDVYDRFFTRIEQRVSRTEILALKDTFASVEVSSRWPYWHFLCRR